MLAYNCVTDELAEAREQRLLARDEVDSLRMRLAETMEATIEPRTAVSVAAGECCIALYADDRRHTRSFTVCFV